MDRSELAVGQAMVVWRGVGTRHKCDARVAKIARKYVTLEVWHGPGRTSEIAFDIETQRQRGATDHYAAIFRTPVQQDVLDRKDAADKGLRYYGIVLHHDVPGTGDRLALEHREAIVALLDERIGRD